VALRCEPRSGDREWAIWWVDSRTPHGALDPPVKAASTRRRHLLFRQRDQRQAGAHALHLSQITPKSARWEQAFSYDAGKTWDTNWVMEFQRTKG
jgi:hypothetical protein